MAEAVHIQSHKRGAMPFLVALRKLEQLACRGSTKELSDALTFFHHQAGHSKVTLINHRIRDHNGRTLVHLAAQNGNHDCLDVLLQGGDDEVKNARSFPADMRQTPLHLAAFGGYPKCIEVLLRHGANPYLRNDATELPLDLAAGKQACESLLRASILDSKSSASPEPSHRVHFTLQDPECHPKLSAEKLAELAEVLMEAGIESSEHSTLVYNGTTTRSDAVTLECKPDPLIAASEVGDKDKVEQLLSDGAEIDSKDSKGRTALITASSGGHTTVTDLLLERGAHIDLQDDEGFSALMTACQNGHIETTSLLLDKDADTFLKNSNGKTAFDLAIENRNNTELLPLFTKLRTKPAYPGILFLEGPKREIVTTQEKTIDLKEVGFSLSIPEDSLPSTDPPLQLEIQPCLSGSFDVPQGIELVSPAYILKPSRRVAFQKEVVFKMWHYANLESEEDCEDMVFLSASTSPEYRGDTPVYSFKEIKEAKGSFRPGKEQPFGEIALKHFCMLALGKWMRKIFKGHLYCARLYKPIGKKVFFCMCLYQPQYMKECSEVMAARYRAPKKKFLIKSNAVKVISTEIHLTQTSGDAWAVVVKEPALILKDAISAPKRFKISDLRDMDYPPRIEIAIQRVPTSPDSGPLCLHVEGLNPESYELLPDDVSQQATVDTSMMECAVGDLKDEIQVQSKSSVATPALNLLPTASEMVTRMETIQHLLHCSDHSGDSLRLMPQLVDEMEEKSEQLEREASHALKFLKEKCDMDIYAVRANTFALQMKLIYAANKHLQHCNTSEWQSALGLFLVNAANLMKAIKNTLRASRLAGEIPNNFEVHPVHGQEVYTHPIQPQDQRTTGLELRDVNSYLKLLDTPDLYKLGTELGLNFTKLKKVPGQELPLELAERWLREDDNVHKTSGTPTWGSLINALQTTGATGVADRIEREKLT